MYTFIGQMAQPRLHLPTVVVLQIIGSMKSPLQSSRFDLVSLSDFGPTPATEKQAERHHIQLSVETVRNWMTADGLWRPHSRRQPRVYQPRYRRACLRELVQIDGSHHDWLEGRAPK